MNREIFEAWYDEADHSVELAPLSEIVRVKTLGKWLEQPVFLHRIEAESLEAAAVSHQEKMDWDNFHLHTGLIEECQACGVRYFPRRSVACPNCGHRREFSPL